MHDKMGTVHLPTQDVAKAGLKTKKPKAIRTHGHGKRKHDEDPTDPASPPKKQKREKKVIEEPKDI